LFKRFISAFTVITMLFNVMMVAYAENGSIVTINYVQTKFVEDYTYSFGINIPIQKKPIESIRTFIWSDFSTLEPLAETKEISKN